MPFVSSTPEASIHAAGFPGPRGASRGAFFCPDAGHGRRQRCGCLRRRRNRSASERTSVAGAAPNAGADHAPCVFAQSGSRAASNDPTAIAPWISGVAGAATLDRGLALPQGGELSWRQRRQYLRDSWDFHWSTALIGAPGATVGGNAGQGAVYVFGNSGGTWTQTQKLTVADGGATDYFGGAISLDDGTAVIAADGRDDSTGAVYLFDDSAGTWTQAVELAASDGAAGDYFGLAVADSGGNALIGAPAPATNANPPAEAVYFYGPADLSLNLSAPAIVKSGAQYTTQAIATNSASASSPALALELAIPTGASFVSATATQGSCSHDSDTVTCALGPVAGNGGSAAAGVTLKATGTAGSTIDNSADVPAATPALDAESQTTIQSQSGGGGGGSSGGGGGATAPLGLLLLALAGAAGAMRRRR